jgi:hypothetical protein
MIAKPDNPAASGSPGTRPSSSPSRDTTEGFATGIFARVIFSIPATVNYEIYKNLKSTVVITDLNYQDSVKHFRYVPGTGGRPLKKRSDS